MYKTICKPFELYMELYMSYIWIIYELLMKLYMDHT